jgi:predicted ABC-type ATPase
MTDAIRRIAAGKKPVFLLIAGPNGASKSTFTEKWLKPLGFPAVDPDAVGRELFGGRAASPAEALAASKEAANRVRLHFLERTSVALETVFSDTKGYKLGLISQARAAGFRTILIFIGVDSPEICIARVMDRVERGGHDVDEDVIRERFPRCFENLKKALRLVDLTILIDNSGCYQTDGEVANGQRHYVFGEVECGRAVRLERVLPRWYADQGIAKEVEEQCAPRKRRRSI